MMQKNQNRINDAITQGIKLGIELFDPSNMQEIDLSLEIQQSRVEFKALDIFKNIEDYIERLIDRDQKIYWIFDILCNDYNDSFRGVYHIEDDSKKLKQIVRYLCLHFGPDINLNWIDVSRITKMNYKNSDDPDDLEGIFSDLTFKGDISMWDVSNVRDMSNMFWGCDLDTDLSHWDVSNVRNMSYMFSECSFNGDISKWDVRSVRNMEGMFRFSEFNGNISQWNVKNVKNVSDMFECSKFNQDISNWNLKKIKEASKYDEIGTRNYSMFHNCQIKKEYRPKLS